MAEYNEEKAKKRREAIEIALIVSVRRELALQGIDSKIKVSELKTDDVGDIYINIGFEYNDVHSRHENYYLWINDDEIGGWLDPIHLMGVIMADIIDDIRVLNEMTSVVTRRWITTR